MASRDTSIEETGPMKMTSGISLAAVSTLTTRLLWRMPRRLMAVMATVISVITMARAGPELKARPVVAQARWRGR